MKNTLLILTYFISFVPSFFFGRSDKWNLSLFLDLEYRVDYFFHFYSIAINFLILAYCLHYPKGISKVITRFILIITCLDMIHLIGWAKQGFGYSKIIIAAVILGIYHRKQIYWGIKGFEFNIYK